ncbi:MAG: glycosyl hydrolase family 65 protein [Clostridia bacterium]
MHRVYCVCDDAVMPQKLALQETIFHNANGYVGVRAALEEGLPKGMDTMRGTYINGFYELVPMKQAEKLTHVAEEKETMLNAADTQTIRFVFEGERFSLFDGTVIAHKRVLDMDAGITERRVHWRSPKGKEVALCFKRMASFAEPSLFTIDCTITALNFSGLLEVESLHEALCANYANANDPRLGDGGSYLLPAGHAVEGNGSFLQTNTRRSGLSLCSGVRHKWNVPVEETSAYDLLQHKTTFRFQTAIECGKPVQFTKYSVFVDSVRSNDCLAQAKAKMNACFGRMDEWYDCQKQTLTDFWAHADTEIEGDEETNLSMQFNLYQLYQSAGRDGHCGIAAKGLSGEGYEGHCFWDTDMYMLPFFTLTQPKLARNLLHYRYGMLDQARENARLLGHAAGALFPWRTITGRECSGYFLAGTAQYHIDGAIAYAVAAYYIATDDRDYLTTQGGEMLLETARLWLAVGYEKNGHFTIQEVTGPDEYTCLVNNNYYTNACAKYNLEWAVKAAKLFKDWGCYDAWATRLHVSEEELAAFERAASLMLLPYDEALGINAQDDSFLQKPIWDLSATPKENFPLLLHYHPLTLYRYQVCKQADTVLAYAIFDELESESVMRRSFEYYEKITTHDSSLSNCIFCIVACRLGLAEKAIAYFGHSIQNDLRNTHHNTKDGIHTANMGGCYMAVVNGFAGLRLMMEGVAVRPMLPNGWTGYQFGFDYRGRRLHFQIKGDVYTLTLLCGEAVRVRMGSVWKTLAHAGDKQSAAV